MQKSTPAANPDEYAAPSGWRRACVEGCVRMRAARGLDEAVSGAISCTHRTGQCCSYALRRSGFCSASGAASVCRASREASGKYEMATLELREGMTATPAIVRKLTKAAIALNKSLGDPRDAAKPKRASKRPRAKRARA